MPTEAELRRAVVRHGKSLYDRRYAHGSSGNVSVRLPDGMLVTPTNSCMGELDPDHIHTPGIFVKRIVKGTGYEKRIERRTISKPEGSAKQEAAR